MTERKRTPRLSVLPGFCRCLRDSIFAALAFSGLGVILIAVTAAEEVDVSKLPPPAVSAVDFVKDVKPLFENNCLSCHSGAEPKSGFRLQTREDALKGGLYGSDDILPGNSARSRLIHFVARLLQDMGMPPEGKGEPLTRDQVGLLRAWIDRGANWPAGLTLEAPPEVGPGFDPVKKKPIAGLLPPPAQKEVDFLRDIQPIFSNRCYPCHGAVTPRAGLRLDVKSIALGGSAYGPVILPGKSAESRLIHLVAGVEAEKVMPQKGERLTADQIGLLRAWIDQGAHWPDGLDPVDDKVVKGRTHWAFKTPVRSAVPKVKSPKWVRNPIDAFIAAGHEARGLVPAHAASPQVLIRRLSLDLTGLPPTPEEMQAFLADTSSDAYEKLVDRVLASPHYGERWGRHWLDLARWAETDGYEGNELRTSAWRYRDYVIDAFNRDKPYDRFLREQIAGDEMVPYSDENLIATGFLASGRLNNVEEDKAVQRNDMLIDLTNAVASVTLGLSMNCAQCHDHKFDPISLKDYYRFQGFFVRGQVNKLLLKAPNLWKAYEAETRDQLEVLGAAKELDKLLYDPVRARLLQEARGQLTPELLEALYTAPEKRTPEQAELAKEAEKEIKITDEKLGKALEEDDRKFFSELSKKISTLEKELEERKPQTWGFHSPVTSPYQVQVLPMTGFFPLPYEPEKLKQAQPQLLERGDVHRPGPAVQPGWPEIFGLPPPAESKEMSRLALVDWLTSPAHPQVARVWVNYIWQQHFGRGLVATPGDFGLQGSPPTHPELLDWLAAELVENGWSTKHIHQLIVQSNTYRQASHPHLGNAKIDPDNKYWWRWSPRRLEAEVIRDAILFVSGELDPAIGGPSVSFGSSGSADGGAVDPTFAGQKLGRLQADPNQQPRRSLYFRQLRDNFPVMHELFDGPSSHESCPRRHVSTVALQSLYLINNPFILKQAEKFATRIRATAGADESQQIAEAFLLALGRPPEKEEIEGVRIFFQSYERGAPAAAESGGNSNGHSANPKEPPLGLVHLCHALLNLNEFVYLE